MLSFHDGAIEFDQTRCCQCGACLAACRAGALSRAWRDDGLFTITCDAGACTGCKRCVAICPAGALPEQPLTEADWDGVEQVRIGYACDETVRYRASSGGVVRQLIRYALETGACDAAYCLVNDRQYPWAAGRFLRRGDDLSAIANSRYLPTPVCENLRPITGTLLLVGTHCQLLAAERLLRPSDTLRLVKCCILCKQQKTLQFSRFIVRQFGSGDAQHAPMQYRGDGWPGAMVLDGRHIPYDRAAALPFGKRLWCVPGCRFCANPLGANADITFADPWRIVRDAGGGMTLTLTRTPAGRVLLEQCGEAIMWLPCDVEQAKLSVDWPTIRQKQQMIAYYRGQRASLRYRIGDWQRGLYERLLLSRRLPALALKILNRLPYLG